MNNKLSIISCYGMMRETYHIYIYTLYICYAVFSRSYIRQLVIYVSRSYILKLYRFGKTEPEVVIRELPTIDISMYVFCWGLLGAKARAMRQGRRSHEARFYLYCSVGRRGLSKSYGEKGQFSISLV